MMTLEQMILSTCDRNVLRTARPTEIASWTITKFWRDSTGDLESEPTEHEFDNYRDAESYAESLNNGTDVTEHFWYEAEEVGS